MPNPDPSSQQEPTPSGDALREYLALVDQAIEAITDADVDADLAAVLAKAGYGPVTTQSELRLADFELAGLPDSLATAEIECQLRATNAELTALQVEVVAARQTRRREVGRLYAATAAADAAAADAAEARKRAHEAAAGAEAYVNNALDRAQEILDKARADADQVVADARKQAAAITAATVHRPPPGLQLPDTSRGVVVRVPGELWAGALADHPDRHVRRIPWAAVREGGIPLEGEWEDTLATQRAAAFAMLVAGDRSAGKSDFVSALVQSRMRAEEEPSLWNAASSPAAEAEAECPAPVQGQRKWAAIRSALRKAFAVPRLCQQGQPSAAEREADADPSLPETAQAGPPHRSAYVVVLMPHGHNGDGWLPDGDAMDVAPLEGEDSAPRALCGKGEHISAPD